MKFQFAISKMFVLIIVRRKVFNFIEILSRSKCVNLSHNLFFWQFGVDVLNINSRSAGIFFIFF